MFLLFILAIIAFAVYIRFLWKDGIEGAYGDTYDDHESSLRAFGQYLVDCAKGVWELITSALKDTADDDNAR